MKFQDSSLNGSKVTVGTESVTHPLTDAPKAISPINFIKVGGIKMSSFKRGENIQKKEGGPDRSVSDNQSSSVTLNELAMKARKIL